MKTGERLIGVFIKPKETFNTLAEKPVWVDALIIVLIALAIYSYLIAPLLPEIHIYYTSKAQN